MSDDPKNLYWWRKLKKPVQDDIKLRLGFFEIIGYTIAALVTPVAVFIGLLFTLWIITEIAQLFGA